MKSIILIGALTLLSGAAFGQAKVKSTPKPNLKSTTIQKPKVKVNTVQPGTPKPTENNRKRPGGTINTNTNSKQQGTGSSGGTKKAVKKK